MKEGITITATSADEKLLLTLCRKMNPKDQKLLLHYANSLVSAEEAARPPKDSSFFTTNL